MTAKTELRCPKCGQSMMAGFIGVSTDKGTRQNAWAEGEMWFFLLYGGKTTPVTTYRCPGCGYLESYAK